MPLEQQYQQQLLGDLAQYEFKPRTTRLKNGGGKWRVASALQKAIRRGDVDTALRTAHGLHEYQPDYVWRRLCTVVMEDVGIGDLELCARFLWVSTRTGWREAHGGSHAFLYLLVEQMCRSDKDRNANDLAGWAEIDPDLVEYRKEAATLPRGDLAAVLTGREAPIELRALAFQALGYWDHAAFSKSEGFTAGLAALREAGFPELVLEVARMGRQKQYEAQPCALPLVWDLAQRSPTIGVVPDAVIEFPPIKGYPSSAFDRHNREGVRAILRFLAECQPLKTALAELVPQGEDEEAHRWALEALIFRVEGHQVDRRLVYDGAKEIDANCTRSHLSHNYIPPEAQAELLNLTREHLPQLDAIRRKVCLRD